jgi:guanylate kinase
MNFEKPSVLSLTGSSGTGKSSIIREIQQRNKFERFLGDTTRYIRGNEINNPEYNHISKNDFLAKVNWLKM